MVRTTLTALALLAAALPALAGNENPQLCQFNGGKWIDVTTTDNGPAFTLKWADGPRMSYVWKGSNADRWNITDTLGGRWNFYDYRYGRGIKLTNLDNGNTIRCRSTNS